MTDTVLPTRHRFRDWLDAESPEGVFQSTVQQFWRVGVRFALYPLGMIGLGVILLIILVAIFAPWLTPYEPAVQDMINRLQPPSATPSTLLFSSR